MHFHQFLSFRKILQADWPYRLSKLLIDHRLTQPLTDKKRLFTKWNNYFESFLKFYEVGIFVAVHSLKIIGQVYC